MNKYSALEKFFHRISLAPKFIREVSFDIEQSAYLKKCPKDGLGSHVFVTGLARSGTTIILNALHDTGAFASLTYENMPFILAPNLWGKVNFFDKHKEAAERAHGDGIMVSTNSPEAFEEVFWSTFESDDDWQKLFRNYISLILLKAGKTRYLSKNNQNICRLAKIRKTLPDAHILVPFRDPLQHSYSLLTQHKKFSDEQSKDTFTRNYMKWIGHSEFGLDYKPLVSENLEFKDYNRINHWLEQWLKLYQKTYDAFKDDQDHVHFICYENLCRGQNVQQKLNEILGITLDPEFNFRESKKPIRESYDENLLGECLKLYERMAALQRQSVTEQQTS